MNNIPNTVYNIIDKIINFDYIHKYIVEKDELTYSIEICVNQNIKIDNHLISKLMNKLDKLYGIYIKIVTTNYDISNLYIDKFDYFYNFAKITLKFGINNYVIIKINSPTINDVIQLITINDINYFNVHLDRADQNIIKNIKSKNITCHPNQLQYLQKDHYYEKIELHGNFVVRCENIKTDFLDLSNYYLNDPANDILTIITPKIIYMNIHKERHEKDLEFIKISQNINFIIAIINIENFETIVNNFLNCNNIIKIKVYIDSNECCDDDIRYMINILNDGRVAFYKNKDCSKIKQLFTLKHILSNKNDNKI